MVFLENLKINLSLLFVFCILEIHFLELLCFDIIIVCFNLYFDFEIIYFYLHLHSYFE